jgi:hypothetical protein
MRFNVNHHVRVKLTERGHQFLRERHRELFAGTRFENQYVPPEVDADGWSRFQLWDLMNKIGPAMHMGADIPIETEIELETPSS